MQWKKIVNDYLSFTRKDRIGILVLTSAILLVYLLPYVLPSTPPGLPIDESALLAASDSIDAREERPESPPAMEHLHAVGRLFAFDPNTLDAPGWEELGLPARNVKTILNYRSKGGRFRRPEDLQRIWGLPTGFYEKVRPFIRLQEDVPERPSKPSLQHSMTISLGVNSADSSAWERLPGIGARLASRIVLFREKLGGFYSLEQVGETYGLQDSVFQKLKPLLQLDGSVRKVNINTAPEEQLKNHPYIRWKLARLVVEFRNQHGSFTQLSDLQLIPLVDDALFKKLLPYLTLE